MNIYVKKNHYACRGGNFDTVDYLLKEQTGAVSERNSVNKLPIHLMCEHGERSGKNNSLEYVETTWRLLLAQPNTSMDW